MAAAAARPPGASTRVQCVEATDSVRELQTRLRDDKTPRWRFILCANRLVSPRESGGDGGPAVSDHVS